MKQSVRHSRRTLALMTDVALQHTKVETFEEVRPILRPTVGAIADSTSSAREHSGRRARKGSFENQNIPEVRAERNNLEANSFGHRNKESSKHLRRRTLSEQDLQRSSSRKLFGEALRPQERKTAKRRQRMEVLLRGGVVISLAPSMHVCV